MVSINEAFEIAKRKSKEVSKDSLYVLFNDTHYFSTLADDFWIGVNKSDGKVKELLLNQLVTEAFFNEKDETDKEKIKFYDEFIEEIKNNKIIVSTILESQ